jgi:ferredoxin
MELKNIYGVTLQLIAMHGSERYQMDKILKEGEVSRLVERLLSQYQVFGPKRKGTGHVFDEIKSGSEIDLAYITTILPPKKYLLPQREKILSFDPSKGIIPERLEMQRKQLIFGIHSCDLNAFLLLDKVFIDKYPLPSYVERRRNTVTVALTCTEVDDACFCSSMGTGPSPDRGYDVLLTWLGDRYLAEAGSAEGEKILDLIEGGGAGEDDYKAKLKVIENTKKKFRKKINTEGLTEIIKENLEHKIWDELGELCLACAQCVMSCPTCYCFDVRDTLRLNLKEGFRFKEWDSCLLLEFAEVALGGNFRSSRAARIRQFIGHNLGWGGASQYEDLNGRFKCVGCGRCIRVCPVHIDLTDVASRLRGEVVAASI